MFKYNDKKNKGFFKCTQDIKSLVSKIKMKLIKLLYL